MSNSTKENLKTEIQNLKETGENRAKRLREIAKRAISDAKSEFAEGSVEIRRLLKNIVQTVAEVARDRKSDLESDVKASLEGGLEAMGQTRREAIADIQTKIQHLQSNLDQEEAEFETEMNQVLIDIEAEVESDDQPRAETGNSHDQDSSNRLIASVIRNLRESEEVQLLQKRYAQLRTQLAILRANLAARYGDQAEQLQDYLDDAKSWYNRAQPKAEALAEEVKLRQERFEQSLEEAGRAAVQREREIKTRLQALWQQAVESFKN